MNVTATPVTVLYYPGKAGAAALATHLAADIGRTRAGAARVLSLHGGDLTTLRGCALAIVVGGDGSILSAARLCAPLGIPLLPVQLGRLGQLAEVEARDVGDVLPHYPRGDCWRDARLMLTATLDGAPHGEVLALNDIVVARGISSGPIRVEVTLGVDRYGTVWKATRDDPA